MANKPILWSSFPGLFDAVKFKDPEQNKAGGSSVFATVGEPPELLRVQLTDAPKKNEKSHAYLPFGISKPYGQKESKEEKEDNANRKSVDIAVSNPKVIQVMEQFEAWIVKKMAEESKRFFGKPLKEEQIVQKMKSSIKRDEDPTSTYPPRIRTKININGPFAVKVTINAGDKSVRGTWNSINQKGAGCLPILRFGGLWFASGSWGPTWEIHQILIYPRTNNDTLEFVNDGGDVPPMGEDDTSALSAPAPAPAPPVQATDYDFSMTDN
jgi:hypothetical protein